MIKARRLGLIGTGSAMLMTLAAPLQANEHGVSATSTGSTTGSTTSGMMVTTSTGGSTTTSGFCIPGGLGCGPDSDLTPLQPDQIITGDGVVTVPEPSGAALLAIGLGLFGANRIRRRRKLG